MASRVEQLEVTVEQHERNNRQDNLLFYNIPGDRDEPVNVAKKITAESSKRKGYI